MYYLSEINKGDHLHYHIEEFDGVTHCDCIVTEVFPDHVLATQVTDNPMLIPSTFWIDNGNIMYFTKGEEK